MYEKAVCLQWACR